jgi:hypothetical protein
MRIWGQACYLRFAMSNPNYLSKNYYFLTLRPAAW